MKRSGPLVGLYGQFTPHERFLLALEADARGDETERQVLERTCPRHCYVMTDAAFTRRVEVSQWLTLAVMTDTLRMLGWLDLLGVLRPVLDDDEFSDARLAAMVSERAQGIAASRVKAMWEAFQDACREEIGVDPMILLRANGIPLEDRLAEYTDELAAVERDAELYAEYRKTVEAVWAKGEFT
jgi:hypothetical protein